MTTRFLGLCTLGVTHAYYNGVCRDFTFLIPADTSTLLKRGRLIAKILNGRLHVLFEAGEDGKPVMPMAGAVLRIGLQLTNAAFTNFTALTFTPGSTIATYSNGAAGAQLAAPATAAVTGRLLTRTLSRADRPVDVTVANAGGKGPATTTVTAEQDRPSVSIDFNGFDPGIYTLTEQYPAGVSQSATYYVDPELSREPLFGIVEIRIAAGFYTVAPAFTVAFEAKAETLKYYVVTRGYPDAEFDQIAVTQFVASGAPEITFSKKLPAAFTAADVPVSVLGGDEAKVALFQSDALVKRRAAGYARVQLSRNGDVIIGSLPQAAADRPSADLIVHLSKPKP